MFVFGTAEDVFAMAVRIEENGNTFYTGAAKLAKNAELRTLFENLAKMEQGHILTFKALRSRLSANLPGESVWDPEGLAESYLQATADTHIFSAEVASERIKQIKTSEDALNMAIQFEKDSVSFFMGMKELLPDASEKQEIDSLIFQEMDHVRMLAHAKRQLSAGESPGIS
jgi:rubrerythrin